MHHQDRAYLVLHQSVFPSNQVACCVLRLFRFRKTLSTVIQKDNTDQLGVPYGIRGQLIKYTRVHIIAAAHIPEAIYSARHVLSWAEIIPC